MKPVGKIKAELDNLAFEAELGADLRWRCSWPHLALWLNSRYQPRVHAGSVYGIGRKLLMRTAEALGGEYEWYELPPEALEQSSSEGQSPESKSA